MVLVNLNNYLSWPLPNYVDPPRAVPGFNYIVGFLMITMCLIVGLRYYSRIFVQRWFGIDDAFIGLALVCLSICYISRRRDQGLTCLHIGINAALLCPHSGGRQ